MEDVDFCYRCYLAGFGVYFLPTARVIHLTGESAKNNIRMVLFHQHISKIRFFKKHYSRAATKTLETLFFIELCGKILFRSLQWVVPSRRLESCNRLGGYVAALDFIVRGNNPTWA